MNIHAMSRKRAEEDLSPDGSAALISISTPGFLYFTEPPAGGWQAYLPLAFSDVATVVPGANDGCTRFSAEMASQVVTLLQDCLRANVIDLYIHCDKGQSRSVGIGEALRRIGVGSLHLYECARATQANELVLTRMSTALSLAGLAPARGQRVPPAPRPQSDDWLLSP